MELDNALRTAGRRMRTARAARFAERGVIVGSIVAAGVLVLQRWNGDLAVTGWWLLLLPVVAGILAFMTAWIRSAVPRFDAAVAVDRRLGLRERISTSTWLTSAGEEGGPHRAYVQGGAAAEILTISPTRIREAFPIPRPGSVASASLVAVVLAIALAPFLPASSGGAGGLDPGTKVQQEREAQRVRESARRLAKNAAELARAAELAKLETARALARTMEQEARAMASSPPSKRDALANLARMSASVRKDLGDQLGLDAAARAFGGESGELKSSELAGLSDLARQLDQLDPDGLSLDLDEYQRSLGLDLDRSRTEGSPPVLDEARTRDLMDRIRDMEDLLRQAEKALREQGAPEYQSLSQETADLLRKIREKLGEMGEYSSSCSGAGCPPMDEEALRKMLTELNELLDSLSAEEIEQLMSMLNEARLGQSMEELISQCRSEMSGSLGKMSPGDLSRMLQALAQLQSCRSGSSSRGGGQDGRANGGGGDRGEDDGTSMQDERVRGALDPAGDLGDAVPFRGIPKSVDAKLSFDDAVLRAAAAAEEGLGRDLLAPDAKPIVRRYFEALREESAPAGGSPSQALPSKDAPSKDAPAKEGKDGDGR